MLNYLGWGKGLSEFKASYSFPNPVTAEFAPNSRTRGVFTSTLGKAISRQSSICKTDHCHHYNCREKLTRVDHEPPVTQKTLRNIPLEVEHQATQEFSQEGLHLCGLHLSL